MTKFLLTACSWLRYNKTKIISDTRSRALQPELLWIPVYDSYMGRKVYPLFMFALLKTNTLFMKFGWKCRPYRVAYPLIVHIWEYPTPSSPRSCSWVIRVQSIITRSDLHISLAHCCPFQVILWNLGCSRSQIMVTLQTPSTCTCSPKN